MRGFIFGTLISTFCLGQFFSGPILGAFSDRKGRRKILLITVGMAFISYIFAGCAILGKSIVLLYLSRLMAGVAAGNYAIAQSMVVDCTAMEDRAKNFGLLGMAWGSGFGRRIDLYLCDVRKQGRCVKFFWTDFASVSE